MGKKRIVTVGKSEAKKKVAPKRLVKSGKQQGRLTDMGQVALEESTSLTLQQTKKETTKKRPPRKRGSQYLKAKSQVDRTQTYPLSDAIKLLKKVSISEFNGSVEVHLNTYKTGLQGEIKFPHDTGKTIKIAIADDSLLKKIAKGQIDFNLLLATPQMMPKLAKYAKTLGPKGLMPNPKAGTITDKPEKTAQKLKGIIRFKTEVKFPLIHLVIGKVNDPVKNLEENFQALIKAVEPKNIKKAVIAPTMGPGIKVNLASL